MEPITAALIGMLILLVIGGVWGYTIIRGLMQRRVDAGPGADDVARRDALRADYELLEARLAHVEEELEFRRALESPAPSTALPERTADDAPSESSRLE